MKTTLLVALLSSVSSMAFAQITRIDSIGNISPATIAPPVIVEQGFSNELIPAVLALTVPFIMVVAIVFFSMKYMTKEKIARYKMIEAAMDKGVTLPNFLFEETPKKKLEKNLLYTSVRNILVGFVLFLGIWLFLGLKFGIWLLILTAVGVAQLITYLSEKKEKEFVIRKEYISTDNKVNQPEEKIEIVEAEEINAQEEHIDGEVK